VIEKRELEGHQPRRTQQVIISMRGNSQTIIHGASSVIEFGKLFLRDVALPTEKDIEIDENGLKDVATSIWLVQEFLDA